MTQPTPDPAFSVVVNRTINAPRERVFEAWTNPAHLYRWWAVREDYTAPIVEVDLRTGGSYRLGMQDPDQEHPFVVSGVYREVTPPEKLVFTWKWETAPDGSELVPPETLVTIEFFDRGESTDIRLTHETVPRRKHARRTQPGLGRMPGQPHPLPDDSPVLGTGCSSMLREQSRRSQTTMAKAIYCSKMGAPRDLVTAQDE